MKTKNQSKNNYTLNKEREIKVTIVVAILIIAISCFVAISLGSMY